MVEPSGAAVQRSGIIRELVSFYGLAFAISWLGFAPLLADGQPVLLLVGLGPALAAWLVVRGRGRLRWRAGWRWFGATVAVPLAVMLVLRALGPPPVRPLPLASTAIMALPGNVWEEIGWRGFAQPRLHTLIGLWPATLVIGVLWAAWHAPFLLWHESPMFWFNVPAWPRSLWLSPSCSGGCSSAQDAASASRPSSTSA